MSNTIDASFTPVNDLKVSKLNSEAPLGSAPSAVLGDDLHADEGHKVKITGAQIGEASQVLEEITRRIDGTSLSFSISEDLGRVIVRVVGSKEIVRQFPPEEFIKVAEFLAAQDPMQMNEEELTGILLYKFT